MNEITGRIGRAVRRARYAAGLTQEELAHLSGVSTRTIGDLECGRIRRPRHSTIRSLARALKLTDAETRELNLLSRREVTS